MASYKSMALLHLEYYEQYNILVIISQEKYYVAGKVEKG